MLRRSVSIKAYVPVVLAALSIPTAVSWTHGQRPAPSASGGAAASSDAPLPNGPPPVYWSDGNTTYRAVHEISAWDPTGRRWTPLSPDLTEARIPGTEGYGVDGITAFMRQGSTWYVGTLTGNLLVGQGGHWQNHSYGLPNRTIVQVAPLPDRSTDTGIAVGFAGYASATPDHPGHVYETTDGGQTWRDISGNLPDAPVQWLADVEDDTGRRLVVKMAGRWFCLTSSRHWVAWQGTD